VPLSALAAAIASPAAVSERSVAITFDDGHASFLRLAMPVFETLGIPVTMFVVSDLLEPGSWLWTDKLQSIATAMPTGSQWSNDRLRLRDLTVLEPGERDRRLRTFAETAGVELPDIPPQRYQLLSWSELEQLAANPLVEIGSHTRSHRLLAALDAEAAWDEIRGSKERLEARLGIEVRSFAYPFGLEGDYLDGHVALVRKAGYRCAVTCSSGNDNPMTDPFMLPRVGVEGGDPTFFSKHVDGFELLQRRFLRRLETGQHQIEGRR
jgi:peptidoglycan/xylan/chitin deacetylase (PgdA/CDA1 family)